MPDRLAGGKHPTWSANLCPIAHVLLVVIVGLPSAVGGERVVVGHSVTMAALDIATDDFGNATLRWGDVAV